MGGAVIRERVRAVRHACAMRWARPQLVNDDALAEVTIYASADGKIHVTLIGSGTPEDAARGARMCFAGAQILAAQAGLVVVAPAPER